MTGPEVQDGAGRQRHLHLSGCAIGEIVGLMIGAALGVSNAVTIAPERSW